MYANTDEQRSRERVQALAEQLHRERYHYLLRIAAGNAASREDAEEAVQFSFAAFIEKFDPSSGSPPLGWLALTAKRACWAAHRAQHLDRSAGQEAEPDSAESGFSVADIPAETPGGEEAVERAEYVLEARAKLAALKAAERRAIVLIAAGYSYREVGQITGFSYTKTNRSAAEGRAALRAAQIDQFEYQRSQARLDDAL